MLLAHSFLALSLAFLLLAVQCHLLVLYPLKLIVIDARVMMIVVLLIRHTSIPTGPIFSLKKKVFPASGLFTLLSVTSSWSRLIFPDFSLSTDPLESDKSEWAWARASAR